MGTLREEIERLEREILETKYNKATEHHIGKLKAKLARLKDAEEKARAKKSGHGYAVRKSGHATVALVGFPSVGKSTLLNQITDAESEVADYEFTTLNVVPGIMKYCGASIQVLDLPGIIEGASQGRGRGREVLSVLRSADLLLLMLDVFETHLHVLLSELYEAGIRINQNPPSVTIRRKERGGITIGSTVELTKMDENLIRGILEGYGYINADVVFREDIDADRLIDFLSGNRVYTKGIVVLNKVDLVNEEYLREIMQRLKGWKVIPISAKTGLGLEELRREIYASFEFMRIYLKPQGKKADFNEPLIIKKDACVGDVCDNIHRDFRRRFRYAIVWGKSAKFDGQRVGLSHVLQDGDVVSIIISKNQKR